MSCSGSPCSNVSFDVDADSSDACSVVSVDRVAASMELPVVSDGMPTEVAAEGAKHRCWCFTWNNYTKDDIALLKGMGGVAVADGAILSRGPTAKYLIFAEEVSPTTGTPHLQGFVQFDSQVFFSALNQRFGRRCWLAVAKATPYENRLYVTKTRPQDSVPNDCVYEYGKMPKERRAAQEDSRLRYARARRLAIENRIDEIDADLLVRFYQTWKRMRDDAWLSQDLETLQSPALENEWLWGPPGTGKSRDARNRFPNAYLKNCNKWWDGYAGEDVVIIEDFDKRHDCLVHFLKIWADRYPFHAEVKLSSMKCRPRKIIVTSNYSIGQIWFQSSDRDPLLRRFQEIEFFVPGLQAPTASAFVPGFSPPAS